MEENQIRPRIRFRAIAIGVVLGLVVIAFLPSIFRPPKECGYGEWPAFALSYAATKRDEPSARIMWCLPTSWRVLADTGAATLPAADRGPARGSSIFGWFDPDLTPHEAWEEIAPGIDPIPVNPGHGLASSAFKAVLDSGTMRMEFSQEGIPVRVRTPGPDGVRFWATSLDRANLPIMSDDALLHHPLCHSEGDAGVDAITNAPCWSLYGRLLGERCAKTFSDHTSTFVTASCSL